MPKKRKDGWYVVQMLLRESEYNETFEPERVESGLSESSLMRVKFGLPALKDGVKARGKGARKKGGSTRASASLESAAPRRSDGAGNGAALPFVAHRDGDEQAVAEAPTAPLVEAGAGQPYAHTQDGRAEHDIVGVETPIDAPAAPGESVEIKIDLDFLK
jgi:hypothetical protein